MKKKNIPTSQTSRFLCVSGCAVKHYPVLCQWLPLQHSEPASFTACDQDTHSGPPGFRRTHGVRYQYWRVNRWPMYSSRNVLPPYLQNEKTLRLLSEYLGISQGWFLVNNIGNNTKNKMSLITDFTAEENKKRENSTKKGNRLFFSILIIISPCQP